MSKFKPGDRVICIKDSEYSPRDFFRAGDIAVVDEIEGESFWAKEKNNSSCGRVRVFSNRFQLYHSDNKTQFKIGDHVICIKEVSGLTEGVVYQVCEVDGPYLIKVYKNGNTYGAERFKLIDIEQHYAELINKVNVGLSALADLAAFEVKLERKFGNEDWKDRKVAIDIVKYRIKAKPTFEPFSVGGLNEWTVSLDGSYLNIGCKKFLVQELKPVLTILLRENYSEAFYRPTDTKFSVTRTGINNGSYQITWEDAEKILKALENIS